MDLLSSSLQIVLDLRKGPKLMDKFQPHCLMFLIKSVTVLFAEPKTNGIIVNQLAKCSGFAEKPKAKGLIVNQLAKCS
jgi:hypothetical protein